MQCYQRGILKSCRTSRIFGPKRNAIAARYFSSDDQIEENAANNEQSNNKKESSSGVELSGFAKSFAKYSQPEPEKPKKNESFAHLLRHSKFIDLGDPEGKTVPGKIFHVVGDDLYIDFGSKFYCVCPRPLKSSSNYVRGAVVRIRIKNLELSTKFLGASKDLTLLEADCTLTALISTPMKNVHQTV